MRDWEGWEGCEDWEGWEGMRRLGRNEKIGKE